MSSELKRQVAALQKQRTAPDSLISGKASLFLSKKEAGNVDTSAVLDAAVDGLNALAQYDDRFSWCLDTLLHPSSVDYQRELKTKEVSLLCFDPVSLTCRRKTKPSMQSSTASWNCSPYGHLNPMPTW